MRNYWHLKVQWTNRRSTAAAKQAGSRALHPPVAGYLNWQCPACLKIAFTLLVTGLRGACPVQYSQQRAAAQCQSA